MSPRPRAAIILLILAGSVLLTYFPILHHGFVNWDDQAQLYQNPDFNPPTLQKISRYWHEPHMQLYLPLTYSVWGAVAAIAYNPNPADGAHDAVHLSPTWFHALNLITHLACVTLVFLLLRRLVHNDIAAAIGASIFGLHPLMVEPVAWASAFYTLFSTALALLALWQHVVFAQRDTRDSPDTPESRTKIQKWRPLIIATLAFALALLAKPSVVVVPLMAAVIDGLLIRRPLRRIASIMIFWLILATPIALLARHFQPARIVPDTPLPWRPVIALDAIGFYTGRLLLPIQLAADYGRAPDRVIRNGITPSALVGAAMIVLFIVIRRRSPWALAGFALFVLGMLPYLGLTKFDFQWFSTVADRYVYLSMLGVALFVAFLVEQSQRQGAHPRATVAASVIVLIVLALLSVRQTRIWHDTQTLFTHTLSINPRSLVAHNVLAYFDSMHARPADAEEHYRHALATRPDDPAANFNYANLLASQSRLDDAIAHYETTLAKTHENVRAMNNLAIAYARAGRSGDAEQMLRRALDQDPRYADAHANLGLNLVNQGRLDEARDHFERALQLDPNNIAARRGLDRLSASAPGKPAD